MSKVGTFVQFTCVAAAPLALWFSAPSVLVRGVDLYGGDAGRFAARLSAVDARIVQVSPDGSDIVAIGAPVAMTAALLRAGALPLPLVAPNGACTSRSARQA